MAKILKKLSPEIMVPFMLFVVLFLGLSINGYNQKKILVLHSYYTDYAWVNGIDAGLDSVLGKQNLVKVKKYYMDTKRHPDKWFVHKASDLAKKIVDSEKPDILIAIDDEAQNYVAKHYINSKNMAIVFLGVNNTAEAYGYDKAKNVTGYLERIPVKSLIDAVNVIVKNKEEDNKPIKLMHIGDSSITVTLDDKYLHKFKNWCNIELLPSKLVKTVDQWKKAVLTANSKIDALILTNSGKQLLENSDSDKIVNSKELIKWTLENCKHPVIGLNNFLVDDGLPFAVSVSPFESGVNGAECALKIINDKIKPMDVSKHFKIKKSELFIVSMREKQVAKLGWNLPEIYTSFSQAAKMAF